MNPFKELVSAEIVNKEAQLQHFVDNDSPYGFDLEVKVTMKGGCEVCHPMLITVAIEAAVDELLKEMDSSTNHPVCLGVKDDKPCEHLENEDMSKVLFIRIDNPEEDKSLPVARGHFSNGISMN